MTLEQYEKIRNNFNVGDKQMGSIDSIMNTEKDFASTIAAT